MTHKEIAKRLRGLIDATSNGIVLSESIQRIADELDPPRPEPGTVVWWQDDEGLGDPALGQVNEHGCIEMFGTIRELELSEVKWWPVRIAGPMQEIVDIPPLREWPDNADYAELRLHYGRGEMTTNVRFGITRDEAARRQAEG